MGDFNIAPRRQHPLMSAAGRPFLAGGPPGHFLWSCDLRWRKGMQGMSEENRCRKW